MHCSRLSSSPGLDLPAPSVTAKELSSHFKMPWEGKLTPGQEALGRGKVFPVHAGSGSSLHCVTGLGSSFLPTGEGLKSPPRCSWEGQVN